MPKGKASGYRLTQADLPIVFGMVARNDRDHDIAAWFGVNQGRVADAKEGKYGMTKAAPANTLPPKGAPGVKGRRLRSRVGDAIELLKKKGPAGVADAQTMLEKAIDKYDQNEA